MFGEHNKAVVSKIVKLITLVCGVFPIIIFLPQHAHHILLLASALLIALSFGYLLKYKQTESWVESSATIVSVEERKETKDGNLGEGRIYYYPMIKYEYSVNGSRHIGESVSLEKKNVWVPETNSWLDPTPIEKRWWLKLKPGEKITVYTNPREHNESVLIRGLSKSRRSHHYAVLVSAVLLAFLWLILENYSLTMRSS